MLYLTIPPERAGMELDEFLCLSFPSLTKGQLRQRVRSGKILVDGMRATPGQQLKRDQVLVVDMEEEDQLGEVPEPDPVVLPVLYEDEHLLAIDKPAGLSAEPERWARERASLSSALLDLARTRLDSAEGALDFRPRLLHRLDKDTTGVVLVAKTLAAERRLRRAFEEGEVQKTYLALVEGEMRLADGELQQVDLPIAPDEKKSGRMRVDHAEGKPSTTVLRVAERFKGYTLLECAPLTGRTHQIRVHLREIGFPLAVDATYGRRRSLSLSQIKRDYRKKPGHEETPLIARQTLHARAIEFPRVEGEGTLRVESPIPKDFARVLKQLAKLRAP